MTVVEPKLRKSPVSIAAVRICSGAVERRLPKPATEFDMLPIVVDELRS